ncbi:hypothetical protein Q8F55_006655 [Vanrija albida]|uniref:UBA domain-containing protein n=1 Tax=Vanrija albida TaxID=181172 RepID=A0ABR3PYQ6_9TREE
MSKPRRWLRRDEPSIDPQLVDQLVDTGVQPDAAIAILERARTDVGQTDVGLLAALLTHERHSTAAPEEKEDKPKHPLRKVAAKVRPRSWSGSSRPSSELSSASDNTPAVPLIRVDDCRICTEEELAERAEGLKAS